MRDTMRIYIAEYIKQKTLQSEKDTALYNAVAVMAGGDCDYEPLVYSYYKFIEDTMTSIIGKDNTEWIHWYMYDRCYNNEVEISGQQYTVDNIDELITLCINTDECNEAFFKRAME